MGPLPSGPQSRSRSQAAPALTSLGSQSQTSKVGFRRASTVSGDSRYWRGQESTVSTHGGLWVETKAGHAFSTLLLPPSQDTWVPSQRLHPRELWRGQNYGDRHPTSGGQGQSARNDGTGDEGALGGDRTFTP